MLVQRKLPLEVKNTYGGTVLGTAVWSAIHEPRPDHVAVIETLISAGARLDAAGFTTGDECVDEVLRRHGPRARGAAELRVRQGERPTCGHLADTQEKGPGRENYIRKEQS